jgi:hypothetical protein
MITVLSGGVGAARFLQGLVQVVPQKDVTIVSNTGDDLEMFGLHVSPDIDIVIYHLAGVVNEDPGWGLAGDTFHTLDSLASATTHGSPSATATSPPTSTAPTSSARAAPSPRPPARSPAPSASTSPSCP